MIIASLPRCGATKFCIDRSEETGLPFIGELNPMYMSDYGDLNHKKTYHETQFQPLLPGPTFVEALSAPHKYISLVNVSPHLVVASADYVVLRKNMRNAMLSTANFFIKCRSYLKGEGVIQHLYMMHQSWHGLSWYLSINKTSLVWYEDYYGISKTNTDYLDDHKHAKVIYKHIDSLCSNPETNALFQKVKDRYAQEED